MHPIEHWVDIELNRGEETVGAVFLISAMAYLYWRRWMTRRRQ